MIFGIMEGIHMVSLFLFSTFFSLFFLLLFSSWDEFGPILEIILIIGEDIINLTVDIGHDDFLCFFLKVLQK